MRHLMQKVIFQIAMCCHFLTGNYWHYRICMLSRRGWLAICQVWSCIGLASVRLSRLFLTLCSSIRHILKVARQRAACGWSRPEVWGSTQTCLVLEREWLVSCWRVRRLRVTCTVQCTLDPVVDGLKRLRLTPTLFDWSSTRRAFPTTAAKR